MILTQTERWILVNQYRILELLLPDEMEEYASIREALERGFELEYNWIEEGIRPDGETLSEDECREVLDILDMHDRIYLARHRLSGEIDESALPRPSFDGFMSGPYGGNGRYQVYASYVFRSGRYEHLRPGQGAHGTDLETYQRMLAAWRESADKDELTPADLERISAASIHPEHRKR